MLFNLLMAGGSDGGGSVTQDANGYIVLPDTGSGGGNDMWSWMGKNPTKIKTYAKERVYFKDTDFPDWTWSTTQSTLVTGTNYSETVTFDLTQYVYFCLFKFHTHIEYGNWSPTNAVIDFSLCGGSNSYAGYNTVASIQSGTYTSMRSGQSAMDYSYCKNSSGADALISSTYCGLYTTSFPASSSSGSLSAEVMTFKRPAIYVKGNATYFSETAFQNVDMDNSYYEYILEIWRIDLMTAERHGLNQTAADIIVNGLD